MKQRKGSRNRGIVILLFVAVMLTGSIVAYQFYQKIYRSNVSLQGEKPQAYIYIPTNSDFNDVVQKLDEKQLIEDTESFRWVAEKKNYVHSIQPGRYKIEEGMSNNKLVNLLRSGHQEPLNLIFNNVRTKEQLASKVSRQIEADSAEIVRLLNDDSYLSEFDFTPQTVYAMFIPNTYEFWWNTGAKGFIKRMYKEYQRFWNKSRRTKAEKIDFSTIEVSTLASIVDEETLKDEEMPKIAGVYINRLDRGMRLQADPTIKFAMGDFTIKRVLKKHLEIDSPYNTYKNRGLPPGPIAIPSIEAIEAVLNYESHRYLYFCAKPDFSGYHNFAKTHYQHILNAREYQRALNQERIWK